MKVKLICIGKTGKSFLQEGEKEYLGRVNHYLSVEKIEIPDLKQAKKLSVEQIKEEEGRLFLSKINPSDVVILLDERGEEYSSVSFSNFLQKQMNTGVKIICILIGGAYGFSDEIYKRSNRKVSLSKMTYSHQMVRMIFLEQLYRAMTILKGEPYHHE